MSNPSNDRKEMYRTEINDISGKKIRKKDLGMIAKSYGYVARRVGCSQLRQIIIYSPLLFALLQSAYPN